MSDFPIHNFFRLKELFQNKEWDKNDNEQEIFRRFGMLLNNLSVTEQNLILDMCERYRWVPYRSYVSLVTQLFSALAAEDLSSVTHLYLFPVIKPEDEEETKSGNVVLYLYKTIASLLPANLREIKFTVFEQFDKITPENFELKAGELLLLVDDFIGSGSTITSTFSEVDKNPSVKYDQVRVLSLAIMQEAVDMLNEKAVTLHHIYIEQKGITGYYKGEEHAQKYGTMQKIERMTKVGRNFKMGYKKSEALVTMARTPNNTFSIFWADHKKEGETYLAPFKR
jgi:hypothetical protein